MEMVLLDILIVYPSSYYVNQLFFLNPQVWFVTKSK